LFILTSSKLFSYGGTFFDHPQQIPIMNKFFTLFTLLIFLAGSAFRPISGIDDVIGALRTGNANEVAKYIDENVELSLPDKSDNYSKAQAVMILKDFFTSNSVTGFEAKHKGDNSGNQFCIGTLHTRSGDYRTTVFMKTKNGRQSVKEIRFQSL
jgi:hypothetical protein